MIEFFTDKTYNYTMEPEWSPVGAVLLSWPHRNSDWEYILDEVTSCFENLALSILKYSNLIIVSPSADIIPSSVRCYETEGRLKIVEMPTNDTWARDFGALTIVHDDGGRSLKDFGFNAWGLKFPSNYDNCIMRKLFDDGTVFPDNLKKESRLGFILEGGAVESNGEGVLLTTASCLFEENRNPELDRDGVLQTIADELGFNKIYVLQHGHLRGDDTDGHIDTIARFCNKNTIAYVSPQPGDEHYEELVEMEKELAVLAKKEGFRLCPLPMADAVYDEEDQEYRLPATYANFLILNEAVLFPTYSTEKDKLAEEALKKCFPDHKIIGIECSSLIKQHGSLHCVTMQFPESLFKVK